MSSKLDYLDPQRRPPSVASSAVDGILDLCDNAITRDQASFAAFVMSTGGVFTGPQAELWLDANVPKWAADSSAALRRDMRTRFLRPLFHPRFRGAKALVQTHGLGRGRDFAHYYYKPAYTALGNTDSRYRRCPNPSVILQRLLLLDFVLTNLDGISWYGSMKQKLAVFDSLGIGRESLPYRRYEPKTKGEAPTTRYFVDSMPLGVSDWRVVFPVAFADDRTVDAATKRLRAYEPLWTALRQRGLFVHVCVVLQRTDRAEWRRRVGAHVEPETLADRARLLDQVERYLIERLVDAGSEQVQRAYGGPDGLRNRVSLLDSKLAAPPERGEPMAVDVWFADRFSAGPWGVPIPAGTKVS